MLLRFLFPHSHFEVVEEKKVHEEDVDLVVLVVHEEESKNGVAVPVERVIVEEVLLVELVEGEVGVDVVLIKVHLQIKHFHSFNILVTGS
jgi:hypothetical protein